MGCERAAGSARPCTSLTRRVVGVAAQKYYVSYTHGIVALTAEYTEGINTTVPCRISNVRCPRRRLHPTSFRFFSTTVRHFDYASTGE